MRNVLVLASGVGIGAVLSLSIAAAQPRGQAAEQVIAITKAQWAAEIARNISAAMTSVAEDCTMFTPQFPSRLDGKAQIRNLFEAQAESARTIVMAEMSNEKVQVYGDVAVLSYNYMGMGKDKEGNVEPTRAKSTRIYVKQGNQWLLVHANFAPVEAPTN